ncbi:MAG: PLP-dependent aminotransferase family protein [Hyphomonadaceae bacterium]|nr:PLP-dependent aminotransferase family protein [Hyphomonadaceae bacterium]
MTKPVETAAWEPRYAARAERMRASEIRELLKVLDQPGVISFAGGIPDPVLFPVKQAQEAYVSVLADPATAGSGLQYSTSEGYLPLRQWIVRHMGGIGVPCHEDNVVITSGSQQALEFLGRLLLSPGDTALVTAPTYLGALQAFSAYEPRYDELRPEDGNCTPASYAEAARQGGGEVKFAYVVPSFANPTGETLSPVARARLLDLAAELDFPIIEDAAYASLRFEGEAFPPIQALEIARGGSIDRARTIYCGTFSKVLSPGLRVGWIVAAKPVIRRLVLVKQASDLNSATVNQMVMHRMAVAAFDHQVAQACEHYRARRDWMLAALARHMPEGVSWTKPQGGLFTWVRLPEECDAERLLERSLDEAGVAFVPGSAFFFDGRGRNTLRLSFSLPGEEEIDRGIALLARLVGEAAQVPPTPPSRRCGR